MFKKKWLVGLMMAGLAPAVFAMHSNFKNETMPSLSPFYIGISGGYGVIDGAVDNNGQFTQGRLAFGMNAYQAGRIMIGPELGFQSGNTMRLDIPNSILDETGGLEWQATLKPFVDLLLATKTQFSMNYPLYFMLKAGIAYRQLQLIDRDSDSSSLQKINPEVQVGLGWGITEHATLTLFYQGIYSSSSVGASTRCDSDIDGCAFDPDPAISKIPTQQAGFIGVEYTF